LKSVTARFTDKDPTLLSVKEVDAKLARLRTRSSARDQRMRDVLSVRQGDISKVYPAMFSEEYPKPLVANFIDVAARDLAEAMAPLPSFNCSATNMVSDAARKAADTRTRIANFYVTNSDLQLQMYTAADWYNTYGLGIGMVEMDYEDNNPRIRMLNPFGTYPELDRYGRVTSVMQVLVTDAETLAAQYPEHYDLIYSIMRSANPQGIRRVPLELPPGVFTESGVLERELRLGARYPESRSGNIDASVVTGRGVQALQAGFDTQIKAAQAQFARMFQELISVCFEADEKIFGGIPKTIKGSDDGTPYVLKYTPSRDIKGEYGVDVRYGIMSGMDPNRAIIALLQMRSDKLVSRDYVRREIPMDLNVTQEEQRVDIEEMRDSLRVAVAQYAQAIPALAAQGQDPSEIITRIASVIQGRQKGQSLESTIEKAFTPEPVPTPEMPPMAPGMEQQLPAAGAAPAPASAQPPQEQGGMAPAAGQRPDIAQLLAGITGAA
jgi:hypothetical protein